MRVCVTINVPGANSVAAPALAAKQEGEPWPAIDGHTARPLEQRIYGQRGHFYFWHPGDRRWSTRPGRNSDARYRKMGFTHWRPMITGSLAPQITGETDDEVDTTSQAPQPPVITDLMHHLLCRYTIRISGAGAGRFDLMRGSTAVTTNVTRESANRQMTEQAQNDLRQVETARALLMGYGISVNAPRA